MIAVTKLQIVSIMIISEIAMYVKTANIIIIIITISRDISHSKY